MNHKQIVLFITLISIGYLLWSYMKHKKKKEMYTVKGKVDSEGKIVILYYANWCHLCHKVKPIFEELIREQPVSGVKFEMKEDKEVCKYKINVFGYPTILSIVDGNVSEYNGNRTKMDLINYANKL